MSETQLVDQTDATYTLYRLDGDEKLLLGKYADYVACAHAMDVYRSTFKDNAMLMFIREVKDGGSQYDGNAGRSTDRVQPEGHDRGTVPTASRCEQINAVGAAQIASAL